MLGASAYEAPAVVANQVLTGPLARYRNGSGDALAQLCVLCKLLTSNAVAGAIIGRAGHNRDQVQLISGARLQLSRPNEYYPNTSERVLVVSGTLGACLKALFAIAVGFSGQHVETVYINVSSQWKLALPVNVCGYLLGAGGRTMRAITSASDANVSISAEPERDPDLPRERIATVSGGVLQSLRAVGLILDKLLSRPYTDPGEPPFEGQFPASRMALMARTGQLRNPGIAPQQPLPQQQPQQQQAAGALQPATGHPVYGPPTAGASAYVYFPLAAAGPAMVPMGPPMGLSPVHQPMPMAVATLQPMTLAGPLPPPPPVSLQVQAHSGPPSSGSLAAPAGPPPVQMPGPGLQPLPMGTLQPLGPGGPPPPPPHMPMPSAGGPPPPTHIPVSAPGGPPPPGPDHMAAPHGGGPVAGAGPSQAGRAGPPEPQGSRREISFDVPDNRIGVLIGRGGETLHQLQRLLNVSIHIPRRPPLQPGETPPPPAEARRRVTITGARNAVGIAHAFILQRLSGAGAAPAAWGDEPQQWQ